MRVNAGLHYKSLAIFVAIVLLLVTKTSNSATYSEGFESLNQPIISTFTTTNNGLSATYFGGTVFTAGIQSLYHSGVKSWMVDPMGVNNSLGSGVIILNSSAKSLTLFYRDQTNQTNSRLTVFDEFGSVIQEFIGTSSNWQEVNLSRIDGEPLIRSIIVSNMGSGMTAIDDFSYSTGQATTGTPVSSSPIDNSEDESSGSIDTWLIGFLLIFVSAKKYIYSRRN